MNFFSRKYSHDHDRAAHGAEKDASYIETGHMFDHNEYRDLNFRAITQFMIGLFATVALSYISMYGMMKVFQWEHEDSQVPLSPVADTAWRPVPHDIQVAPHVDLTKFRQEEDSVLQRDDLGVEILIEEAIKGLASEGLPYRSATGTTPAAGGQTVADTTGNTEDAGGGH